MVDIFQHMRRFPNEVENIAKQVVELAKKYKSTDRDRVVKWIDEVLAGRSDSDKNHGDTVGINNNNNNADARAACPSALSAEPGSSANQIEDNINQSDAIIAPTSSSSQPQIVAENTPAAAAEVEMEAEEALPDKEPEKEDISVRAQTVPLRDPLTPKRIETPVRTCHCRHLQCFDLEAFVQVSYQQWVDRETERERHSKGGSAGADRDRGRVGLGAGAGEDRSYVCACPVCKRECDWPALEVDSFVMEVLHMTEAMQVRLDCGGQWSAVEEAKAESGARADADDAAGADGASVQVANADDAAQVKPPG